MVQKKIAQSLRSNGIYHFHWSRWKLNNLFFQQSSFSVSEVFIGSGSSVKHFSSKLKEFLQVVDIDSIIKCMIMVVFGCPLLYRFDLQFVIRFV